MSTEGRTPAGRAGNGRIDYAATRLRQAIAHAARGLVERRALTELVALAAVAREHVLILGPPGTAKSQAVRAMAAQLGGQYFEYLLGRFTEPTDIFGAVDLAALRGGRVDVDTRGMLPDAEVAFLDEVFLGSTAILNTLLSILNERVFRRGHTSKPCPLRVCVGASNSLPDDPALEAFADRFLIRVFVEPLPDELLETLLEAGRAGTPKLPAAAGLKDVDALAAAADVLDLSGVQSDLAGAIRALRRGGVHLGDRRIVKAQRLVAAAAVLRGADRATAADLWPLVFCAPTPEQQAVAREVLEKTLAESHNESLAAAAEQASGAPAARALRLRLAIDELLDGDGPVPRLPAEALLREVTASLADHDWPAELADAVGRLTQCLDDAAEGG